MRNVKHFFFFFLQISLQEELMTGLNWRWMSNIVTPSNFDRHKVMEMVSFFPNVTSSPVHWNFLLLWRLLLRALNKRPFWFIVWIWCIKYLNATSDFLWLISNLLMHFLFAAEKQRKNWKMLWISRRPFFFYTESFADFILYRLLFYFFVN